MNTSSTYHQNSFLFTAYSLSVFDVLVWFYSYGVVAIAPFSHRLAFNELPNEIQRLRCKVNFEALRFVPSIERLGNTLVERLRKPHAGNLDGDLGGPKFLALHLRFDKVLTQLQVWFCLFLLCVLLELFRSNNTRPINAVYHNAQKSATRL
jgi:hypothetical protein